MASICISNLMPAWPPNASQVHKITASRCIYKLIPIWPPRSHDRAVQMHLQTHSFPASKYISNLPRSRPRTASLTSLHYHFQVNLQTSSIMASKFASWLPALASPISLNQSLEVPLRLCLRLKFRGTSTGSLVPPAASRDIPCIEG